MGERSKPILCIDFDGVVHSYASGWKGETVIADPPVKGSIRWLWKATEWFEIQIYSSRSKSLEGRLAMLNYIVDNAKLEFGDDHPMSIREHIDDYPIGFAYEKPAAFLTIDDRAICFDGQWSELDPADLLQFKPWNKRSVGATGTFPQGVLNDDDEGALKLGVTWDAQAGIVRVDFGKPVAWLGLGPPEAMALAQLLFKHAKKGC